MASDTEFNTGLGNEEETHQHISADGAHAADGHLTTNQGIGVSDNQNQLKWVRAGRCS
jgi:catalase